MEKTIGYYFKKHLSDKNLNGYSPVYDEYFGPRRNDKINLLEIGIGTLQHTNSNMVFWKDKYPKYEPGASLRAFKDYFPNGTIYGVDIQIDCMIKEDRIVTYLFDSTNKWMSDHYFGDIKLDFIIDDGDHYWESQIYTFENFFPKLNDGGIYILEDLAYPDQIIKYFNKSNYNYQFYDGLVVIKN